MKTIGPYKVYSNFGKTLAGEFTTLNEVVIRYSWKNFQERYVIPFTYTNPGSPHYDSFRTMWESEARFQNKGLYICKEANGLIVPKEYLEQIWKQVSNSEWQKFREKNYCWRYHSRWFEYSRFRHNFHTRILPKEKRTKNHKKRANSKRHGLVQTHGEHKAVYFSESQGVRVRAKRTKNYLPDSWDGHHRGGYYNRNWKRFRRTQYKPK